MSESFTITFSGIDEVSDVIQDIKENLEDLGEESDAESGEDQAEIIITSDQVEPEVEQILWDVLEKIKERAVENESEFLLNI